MGSVGVVYRQLLRALRFANDANGCRGGKRRSRAYKSQTRNTSCRSINNPAGAPPPLSLDAACTYMHAWRRVRVYPLSHGGVVIRRVPPVAGVTGVGATKRHVVEKERGGIVRRRQKPSALYYLRIHIGRRGKEQAHIRSLHSRVREEKEKRTPYERTDGRIRRHSSGTYTHSHSITPPGYVWSRTYTHTYIVHTHVKRAHTRRSAASAEDARTDSRRTRRRRSGTRRPYVFTRTHTRARAREIRASDGT